MVPEKKGPSEKGGSGARGIYLTQEKPAGQKKSRRGKGERSSHRAGVGQRKGEASYCHT